MKVVISLLFVFVFAMESAVAQMSTQCDALFEVVDEVKVSSCDKDKIEVSGLIERKKVEFKGSVSLGESAYVGFDLKLKNNFIEPANTGRYITRIDSRINIEIENRLLQIIHSNSIFGDGQNSKDNTYYACTYPDFKKCVALEINGIISKRDAISIMEKILEKKW